MILIDYSYFNDKSEYPLRLRRLCTLDNIVDHLNRPLKVYPHEILLVEKLFNNNLMIKLDNNKTGYILNNKDWQIVCHNKDNFNIKKYITNEITH